MQKGCHPCISRIWKQRNKERYAATERERYHRTNYGSYVKLDFCEKCRLKLEGQRLVIHHEEWKSCGDCNRKPGRSAACQEHLTTLCRPCHLSLHIRPKVKNPYTYDWRQRKMEDEQLKHLDDIAAS